MKPRLLAKKAPRMRACVVLFSVLLQCTGSLGAEGDVTEGTILTLDSISGGKVRIRVEARAQRGPGGGVLYNLSYVGDGAVRPVCVDKDGRTIGALPLEGQWNDRSEWTPEGLTLACADGAIAKCALWGYAPWRDDEHGVTGRELHQACIRMVRADYCGDGTGHTHDGTLINIWDRLGIQSKDDLADFAYEASWTPDGALSVARTRFPDGLDYVRANCPDRLGAKTFDNALLFNESRPDSRKGPVGRGARQTTGESE